MTWNLVQSKSGAITSGVVTPETFAFANPNQSGNLLVLQICLQSSFGANGAPVISGVTDTNGNGPSGSWYLPSGVTNQDMANGVTSAVYYAWNVAAGANTVSLAFQNGISYITGNNNSGTGTSFSASVTPTAIGQMILVWCATLNSGAVTMTVSDNQSNVYTNAIAYHTSSGSIYLWWAVASVASATTYTVTTSSSVAAASFADVYAGVSPNNPVDIYQGGPQVGVGTSTSPAGGSILPSAYGEWLITGMIPAGGTITDPTGYSNRQASSTVVAQSSDSNAIVGIGTAQTPTWTLSASNQWLAFNLFLVPSGPPATVVAYTISEWENSAGAVTTNPVDGAAWSMQTFSNPAVVPQILLPTSAPDDLILMHGFVNDGNGTNGQAGQIGGVNANLLGSTQVAGSFLCQYLADQVPYSTPGFAPGIVPCTFAQPFKPWTGTAVALRFGGNPNTSQLPVLVNNASIPIYVGTTFNVRMQLPCTAGDLIVVSLNSSFSISSVTDSAGNFYQQAAGIYPNYIWYAYNINSYAAGNVVTVVFSGSSASYADVLEYTGIVSTSNPLDQSGFTAPTSGTSGFTPTVTTLYPNELVMAMWTTGAPVWPQLAGGSTTWNYLFNVRDAMSNSEQTEVDLVLGAPGAIVSTGEINGSNAWGCGIATFKGKALFISSQPSNQTVAVGATATFSVTAIASAGSLTYQWQLNGSNIGGATSSSYTTGVLGVGANGTYTCVVTDTYGSTTSQPAYLYVTANPGGGLGIPAIAQVANEEIPASGAAPTSNVVFDSMNF